MMDDQPTDLCMMKEIFDQFHDDSAEGLNRHQLFELCKKLSLDTVFIDQIVSLAFPSSEPSVEIIDFECFCGCFMKILQSKELIEEPICAPAEETNFVENSDVEKEVVAEVEPKYVKNGKSYGRRSVPNVSFSEEKALDVEIDDLLEKDNECRQDGLNIVDDSNVQAACDPKVDESTIPQIFVDGSVQSDEVSEDLIQNLVADNTLNIFAMFDEYADGSVDVNKLFELWKARGITEPSVVLQVLDVRPDYRDCVDGVKLSDAFERFVCSPHDYSASKAHVHAVMCAYSTSARAQLLHFNSVADSFARRNEEIRETLNRSELRNSILVEEADDRCLSIDEQHEAALTELERRWEARMDEQAQQAKRDRHSIVAQAAHEREQLTREIDGLKEQSEDQQHRIQMLEGDNSSLERESHQIYDKLHDSQKEVDRLRSDLECLLSAQISDGTDPINTSQEEKFAKIIKEYESQCRSLGDRNDELVLEVGRLRTLVKKSQNLAERNGDKMRGVSPERKKSENIGEERGSDTLLSEEATASGRRSASRLAELEKAVELLKQEKREEKEKFEKEKSKLIENYERQKSDSEKSEGSTIRQLTEENERIKSEMMNLCREFANEKNELADRSQKQLDELRCEVEETKEAVRSKSEQLRSVTDELEQVRAEESGRLRSEMEQLERSRDEVEQELRRELEDTKREKEERVSQLEKSLLEATAELREEQEMRRSGKEEKERDSERIEAEMERLRQLAADERERTEAREAEFRRETEQVRAQLKQEAQDFKQRFIREMQELSESMRAEAEQDLEIAVAEVEAKKDREIEVRLSKLQKEQRRLDDELSRAREENSLLSESSASVGGELTELRERLRCCEQDNLLLRKELDTSRTELADKSSLYESVCENLQRSEDNLQRDREALKKMEVQKISLEHRSNEDQDQCRSLKKDSRSKDKKIKKLQEELRSMQEAVRSCGASSSDGESRSSVTNGGGERLFRERYLQTVEQLTEQMNKTKVMYAKLAKTEKIVKELYCENSQVMKALQLTEARQKQAERRLKDEVDKREVLANLLHNFTDQTIS